MERNERGSFLDSQLTQTFSVPDCFYFSEGQYSFKGAQRNVVVGFGRHNPLERLSS